MIRGLGGLGGVAVFLVALILYLSGAARAEGEPRADGAASKRVTQCIADNQNEGQKAETLSSYCACMDKVMPSSATTSVSAWEASHGAEQESCYKQSSWEKAVGG